MFLLESNLNSQSQLKQSFDLVLHQNSRVLSIAMGCGASCQVDNIDSLEVGSTFFLWSFWPCPSNQLLINVLWTKGKKPAKTFMYEEDMSHLASDYPCTSGRTTAREKRFFMGILNEDELLPNDNTRPSREGTGWFSHSIEIVPDSRRGWHWGRLGSSFNTQRMNPSR